MSWSVGHGTLAPLPTRVAQANPSDSSNNLLQVRTYDCYISYDKHYQTPRFWLFGYDENKQPLTVKEIFQDVPSEHAFKTMTMEAFPHSGTQLASVHPCKHASVMKKFIDRMEASNADASAAGEASAPGKKRWLGGVMRKVTGGDKPDSKEKEKKASEGEEEPSGVQVDFYLVIVSPPLHNRANDSSSSLLLALCPPSRWTARRPRPSNCHM